MSQNYANVSFFVDKREEMLVIDALEIGYAIKDRRAELGLTQAQVAKAAGVSKRCLWSLELGQNPGVQLDKLTAVLGVLGLDLRIDKGDVPSFRAQKETPSAKPTDAPPHRDNTFDALAILTGKAK